MTKSISGYNIKLAFSLSQDSRDALLFNNIHKLLNCGNLDTPTTRLNQIEFVIYKFEGIINKVIPIIDKYPPKRNKVFRLSRFLHSSWFN